jgi:hypothetical protein
MPCGLLKSFQLATVELLEVSRLERACTTISYISTLVASDSKALMIVDMSSIELEFSVPNLQEL